MKGLKRLGLLYRANENVPNFTDRFKQELVTATWKLLADCHYTGEKGFNDLVAVYATGMYFSARQMGKSRVNEKDLNILIGLTELVRGSS